jgi:AcrR family transcriptional regulator
MIEKSNAKDRIVAVSTEIFIEQGFSKISIDELSREIAISKKTFYKYFDNKEALVKEVVETIKSETAREVERIIGDDKEDCVLTIQNTMKYLSERIGRLGRFVGNDIKRNIPELWEEIDEFRKDVCHRNIEKLFKRGMKNGLIRKDIKPELAVELYFNAIINTLSAENIASRKYSTEEIFKTFGKMFEGILVKENKTTNRNNKGKAK